MDTAVKVIEKIIEPLRQTKPSASKTGLPTNQRTKDGGSQDDRSTTSTVAASTTPTVAGSTTSTVAASTTSAAVDTGNGSTTPNPELTTQDRNLINTGAKCPEGQKMNADRTCVVGRADFED